MKKRLAGLRKFGRYFFLAFQLALLFVAGLVWYTTTESFQQMVRGRLTAAIQRATGGRVELGSFHAVPFRFEVEIRDLTIHGRETRGIPYVHVDSMLATVNLSAVLGAKIGFHTLTLQHPVVHIIFYPDGSTNQPMPRLQGGVDFEQLFAISIDQLNVRRGELLWQDQALPLDFTANDISAGMTYSFFHRRYSGDLAIGKSETQWDGFRPVAWAGRANFAIDRNGVEVRSLKVASGASQLLASGLVVDFRSPIFKGKYDLTLDAQQAGAVSRQPLKAGTIKIRGNASWSRQIFASSGTFDTRELAWEGKDFSSKGSSARGQFSVDPRKVTLSQVTGRFLRGSFTSDAEIVGWRTALAGTQSARAEHQGTVKIKAKDVSLAEILENLGPRFRPVNRLKFAGDVSGTSEIHWHQPVQNTEAVVAFDVSRPGRPPSGLIPLTASGRASYRWRSSELQIADFAAATPATEIRASGATAPPSSLRISFTSTDLREWLPVTSWLFPAGIPFDVYGRAAFNGTATGQMSNLTLAGNLQVRDFDTLRPASAHAATEHDHWDSLTADVQMSPRGLTVRNAVLNRENASLKFDGGAGLLQWKLFPESPIRLRLDVHEANVADLLRLAGHDSDVSGRLDSTGSLWGTASRPQGEAHVTLSQPSIRGQSFDSITAAVGINGTQATIKDLRMARGAARISADGTYDLSSQAFAFSFRGTDFEVGDIAPLQRSRIKIAGKLDFSGRASGTPEQPDIAADLHLRNVGMNQEMLGDLLLNAHSQGPNLRLTGRSNFKNAELFMDGDVILNQRWPARIDFRFNHLDVDSFLESYLHGHVTGHSAVAGALQLRGPLRDPQQLNVTGNLTEVQAELEKIQLHNEGPIQFAIKDQTLDLENVHIVSDRAEFSGSGSMQLAGERGLNFQGRGKADLRAIQDYDSQFSSSGTMTGEAHVTGTLDSPLVKGRLEIENGVISHVNLPSALSEVNGAFIFSQNQITIGSLTARTGGGTIGFTGHAEVGKQFNFDLTASANTVRLRYPPGVSSTANAELHWEGSSAGSTLSGDITVIKLGVTPGFDFAAYLQRSAQVSSLPQTDPVLNRIRLDLHLVTAPELQMQTSVIRLQGDADLRIRGNAAKPVLLGRADVLEGEAYFNGTKYRLERGGVTFNNPAITTPFLDLEATTHLRDYEITLSLSGEIDKPKVNYRSEPPLPTADIIALLAFGQTTEQSAKLQESSQSAFSQQASNALLAAALNATLNNRTQRLFGVSRIKIDPQGLTTETSPTQSGPAVTIEQQVKDNLTITYTTNVAQASQQIIRAEYNVSKNVSIVAIRDQNGVVSFDVKIRRRKR